LHCFYGAPAQRFTKIAATSPATHPAKINARMDAQQGTLLITGQMSDLLQRLPLAVYTCPVPLFHGSTVGQHFRHVLEFYTCLIEGSATAQVDYSSRKRNDALSENPATALVALEYITAAIRHLDAQQLLHVQSEFGETAGDGPAYLSSLGRELQYAFDHAVHHLAIIRMGMEAYFPEVPVSADLGIAPSTIKHRQASGLNQMPANNIAAHH